MKDILGVILCGGESKRMGTDKGLIRKDEKAWVQMIADKITALGLPYVVSINERQVQDYSQLFPTQQLVIDSIQINGPLRGMLTVHQQFPGKDLLLMACDLVDMDVSVMQNILQIAGSDDTYDFFVYENKGLAEPFCGIYTSKGLKAIIKKIEEHTLSQNSFQSILTEGFTKRIELEHPAAFRNYNTMPGHHKNL